MHRDLSEGQEQHVTLSSIHALMLADDDIHQILCTRTPQTLGDLSKQVCTDKACTGRRAFLASAGMRLSTSAKAFSLGAGSGLPAKLHASMSTLHAILYARAALTSCVLGYESAIQIY